MVGSGIPVSIAAYLARNLLTRRLDEAVRHLEQSQRIEIESIKTQLVSEAATRQAVAQAKLALYGELTRLGFAFQQAAKHVKVNDPSVDAGPFLDQLDALTQKLRENEHLIPATVVAAFNKWISTVHDTAVAEKRSWHVVFAGWPDLLRELRKDLYVPDVGPTALTKPP